MANIRSANRRHKRAIVNSNPRKDPALVAPAKAPRPAKAAKA